MVDRIRLLSDTVANQIAAGEVVQRPASVVKELLENAIDAGAMRIQLIVKEAGRELIQVIDDGYGMSATDARMSFERHATSKIRETKDLFSITTKGFRGEALASIAAVARVEMKTRLIEEELGHRLSIEGSQLIDQKVVATTVGTSVAVKDLFYNVPARRNFLKKNSVELRHIIDEFQRVALVHHAVHFSFHHNETLLFNLSTGTLKQRIVQVLGRKFQEALVPVKEETPLINIEGFILKPAYNKRKRGEQFFFVNQRFIKNTYLHKAITEAYKDLLPASYHPSYFMQLELDPARIDINIHPTKTEIKFEDDYALFAILRSAVKHALGQYNIAPSIDFDMDPHLNIPLIEKEKSFQIPKVSVDPNYNPFLEEGRDKETIKKSQELYTAWQETYQELAEEEDVPVQEAIKVSEETKYMQIQKKYILYVAEDILRIVDQYRAHQRILFEEYMQTLTHQEMLGQQLMFPVEVKDLSVHEKMLLEETSEGLRSYGVNFHYREDTLIITTLPSIIDQAQAEEFLREWIEGLSESPDQKERFALGIAKTAAIKRGKVLRREEMKSLIERLLQTTNPSYSPEGKNICINLPFDYILKPFHS